MKALKAAWVKKDVDLVLYCMIGVLMYTNTSKVPVQDWHFWTEAALAGLLVWKAKRSRGKEPKDAGQ